MALVRLGGDISYNEMILNLGTSFTNTTAITTLNTTKTHMIGRFWHRDRTSKNITNIYFRLGPITINAGSVLQVSIQAVDLNNGPPGRGDGTIITSGTIAGSAMASNTLVNVALGTNYTVAQGALFAVVFQLTTFNAGDSVTLCSVTGILELECFFTNESAVPSFTLTNQCPIVFFAVSDGTVGTWNKSCPVQTVGSIPININSAVQDEIGMEFSMPVSCVLSGVRVMVSCVAGADLDIILYQGTTVLATASPTLDQNTISATATNRIYSVSFPETTLTAGTLYTVSIQPTTTANVTVYYADVPNSVYWFAHSAEANWAWKTRINLGAWSGTTSNRRPYMALVFSKLDDGVQTGGGGGATGISRGREQGGM